MWVYRQIARQLSPRVCAYQVGYFGPGGDWMVATEHRSEDAAIRRVNYLNGGDGMPPGPLTATEIAEPEIEDEERWG